MCFSLMVKISHGPFELMARSFCTICDLQHLVQLWDVIRFLMTKLYYQQIRLKNRRLTEKLLWSSIKITAGAEHQQPRQNLIQRLGIMVRSRYLLVRSTWKYPVLWDSNERFIIHSWGSTLIFHGLSQVFSSLLRIFYSNCTQNEAKTVGMIMWTLALICRLRMLPPGSLPHPPFPH